MNNPKPKPMQELYKAALLLVGLLAGVSAYAQPFSFDSLVAQARQKAAEPFVDGRTPVPEALKNLSYSDYQSINFNAEHALWRDEGLFTVQFFHPGFYFDRGVRINVVSDGQSVPVAFDANLFHYRKVDPSQLPLDGLGFAGFRVHYPLHAQSYYDEFAVFLGASYFRLLGRNQQYGLSARGLAIDTALDKGEEFPFFEEFWIEKPAPTATSITVYALLNSPSVTGAYRFKLLPRTETQMEVQAVVFARQDVAKLGLAPLTSMFIYGENGFKRFDDFRPEVHDSDGLMLHTGAGEWLWRPLANRRGLNVGSFYDKNPRGFGLIQRDRLFDHYLDLEANYHLRPSLWIQPLGDWGTGHVELVEIPSDSEINDNIVSFWVPEKPLLAGERIDFTYLMSAYLEHSTWPPGAWTDKTSIGSAVRTGGADDVPPDARLFVVDFAGGDLPVLGPDQLVEGIVTTSSGKIGPPVVQKNTATGGWRVFFDFFPDGENAAELRAFLRLRDHVLTETWNYLWTPTGQ